MRKLLMLATTVLAALAFAGVSATTASATFKFFTPTLQEFCPSVSLVGDEVTGGCLIEDFEGSFDLYVYMPEPVLIGHYESTFDLVLDENGDGYAVNPTVNADGAYPSRVACDGAGGPVPWVVDSHYETWFDLEMDITLNVRPTTTTNCNQQTMNVHATSSWEYGPTELDQQTPSANLSNGYWYSSNPLRVDWGY